MKLIWSDSLGLVGPAALRVETPLSLPGYCAGCALSGILIPVENWPLPPIWPEDLPLIREPLTDEEYARLLRRLVQVNGPLLDRRLASRAETESPERRSDARSCQAEVTARSCGSAADNRTG